MLVKLLHVVCVLPLLALAAPAEDDKTTKWKEHMATVSRFKCRDPQPRLVPLSEILGRSLEPNEIYHPLATVLHRCDAQTGCCNEGQHCGVKVEEPVDLVFIVSKGTKFGGFKVVQAINHKECGCTNSHSSGPK